MESPLVEAEERFTWAFRDLSLLVKLRLSTLVLVSIGVGYWLASGASTNVPRFVLLLIGSFLMIGGANAINEILERREDGLMRRTADRPLPAGRMGTRQAWMIAALLSVSGFLVLATYVNWLTAFLSLLAWGLYIFAYTPLKRQSPWCVLIGAFPGAIPAMMGPAAAQNELTSLSWLLFGIVFLWQFPHFCAISWVARDDYERAGFKVVAVPHDPRFTAYQILLGSLALLTISPLMTLQRHAGSFYCVGALILSLVLLGYATLFWIKLTNVFARKVMAAALLYLPFLFIFMILDKVSFTW